ncbi:b(0,+)-type amino acid transporter 1 [Nymphon striatum]|nr:b(0,+)-type amino acid transporter 1 [Nymphon striatum]
MHLSEWGSRLSRAAQWMEDVIKSLNGFVNNYGGETTSSSEDGFSNSSEDMIPDEIVQLKRRVGLLSGIALIVGTMIGSGIFVSPKGVLERTGSVGLSLIVWAGCGVLAMLGALSYSELGTMLPHSGAEYMYFYEAFGSLPAFMFAWVSVFVLKPSMLAIICLSLGEYVAEPLSHGCVTSQIIIKLIAAFTVIGITYINCFSVTVATKIQNVFTAAKLFAIAIIIVGGLYQMASGQTQFLYEGFEGSTKSFSDIATAFYSGLWAYDGWNNLNYVTEELKNPFKNLPRAIAIGLPLVTICYVLINFSYLAVMTNAELLASDAVAITFGNRVLGFMAWVMPFAVALSTFGAGNGTCFTSGRLAFVAAREGHLIDLLSFIHVRRLTPSPALILNVRRRHFFVNVIKYSQILSKNEVLPFITKISKSNNAMIMKLCVALLSLMMVIPGNIGSLIDFFSFTAWLFYGGTMLALIVMRWTRPNLHRPYKVPLIIPVIVLVISVYLVIAPIVDKPTVEYVYATAFMVAGVVFYIPFVHFKLKVCYMGKFTKLMQLLLEVVPTHYVAAESELSN